MTTEIETQVTDSPAGEVVSPSQSAETIIPETPAVSAEDTELAKAHAAIEQAKTPEEKEQARDGYQRRKDAKEFRETQERARTLELELAHERGRREAYERIGVASVPQVQPQQVQEPVIPAPPMPTKPSPEAFKDAEGYEDQGAYYEALADWKAECKFIERDHQQNIERIKADNLQRAEQGQALVNDIIQAYPDFATKMNLHRPSPAVGEALGILATIDRKSAIDSANYLVNNPAELQRLNAMHPEAARISLGQLAQRLSLPPVQPKKVSNAPPPASQVVSTETHETFDPVKSDMDTYARHHPACAPWLK